MSSFYTEDELKELNFKSIGKNVLISKKASIYGTSNITIGNNVRIDDFCILSGEIEIGDYVHISAYTALYGKNKIKIGDFCGCSARTTIYSASDDFSGDYMISPMVPEELTNVQGGPVILENYVQLGANTTVMPNLVIYEGAVTGTFTLVRHSLEPWTINIGIPSKVLKKRNKNVMNLSKKINGDK